MRKLTALTLAMLMLLTALTGCHQHKWAASTCTEPMTCECGETQGEPNGHSYGDWEVTIAPTYLEKGQEAQTCSACGDQETREVVCLKDQGLFAPDEFMEALAQKIDEDGEIYAKITQEGSTYILSSMGIKVTIKLTYEADGAETVSDLGEGYCNTFLLNTPDTDETISEAIKVHAAVSTAAAAVLDSTIDSSDFNLDVLKALKYQLDNNKINGEWKKKAYNFIDTYHAFAQISSTSAAFKFKCTIRQMD